MVDKIDFYIPFRDRDMERLELCINNLKSPIVNSITVIDYGSIVPVETNLVKVIRVSRDKYPIWNKSHALNIGVKDCKSPYFGTIDCDIIMNPDFMEETKMLLNGSNFICSCNVRRVDNFISYEKSLPNSRDWRYGEPSYSLAIGGVQVVPIDFLTKHHGYHEKLIYWNGTDYYMYLLAHKHGLLVNKIDSPLLHLEHKMTKINILKSKKEKTIANIVVSNRKTVVEELVENGNITKDWGII